MTVNPVGAASGLSAELEGGSDAIAVAFGAFPGTGWSTTWAGAGLRAGSRVLPRTSITIPAPPTRPRRLHLRLERRCSRRAGVAAPQLPPYALLSGPWPGAPALVPAARTRRNR